MVRTAIQLFTLKDLDELTWELVSRVGQTSFDGVEMYKADFDAFEADDGIERTKQALTTGSLEVCSAHARAETIEEEFDDIVAACEAVGISRLVIPTYDGVAFETLEGIETAADRLGAIADSLAEYDIDLLYHNHTFEFGTVTGEDGPEVAFEVFVDRADGRFGFQPDVGLATHAGYDALKLLDVVSGQAPLVHLTDTVPDDDYLLHADVGTGAVDVDACAERAVKNGAEWLICENGRTDDAVASLEHGSEAFAELRSRVGDLSDSQ
ncbi:sugar phosphate isomerase/epimerase family protein [Natronosalvus amylolyticus]|uniref:sugar phosphate isomerase/epimerase family protein n=1 Tax=Natronosalvus amylolyticus TaxID=2961994 RepID=UPI0020C9C073|nr:TIM barrel protein [Natronosalvus amylolyticus]